jgi:D-glycero-D-manno-heptose 1,7-bisphosphate phosphatase
MDKKPAVFVDRDGTLIEMVDVLTEPSQVKLLPGVAEAVADLNRRGFLVIGITNQPIMEKGLLSEDGLKAIHGELQKQLAVAGAHFDAFYTCPHKYRAEGQCACRKPGIKLIEDAQAAFPIDMEHSWFIGDRLRDVETGRRAGIKTILVTTGGESADDAFFPDASPDHVVRNFSWAVAAVK